MSRDARMRERDVLLRQVDGLGPMHLRLYLGASGWFEDGELGKFATIWHRPDSEDAEVVLPESTRAKDFSARMLDAVGVLGAFEGRSPLEIANAIAGTANDTVRIRVFHSDVDGGTIPLEDGVLLNQKARDLMAAVALSTISKRKHFEGPRPPEAVEYLASLRLGQTEEGSYIVNVIAPSVIPATNNMETIPLASFSSVVSDTLTSSLAALSTAVDSFVHEADLTVFDAAVSKGVSANFCDALVGFSGSERTRGFEVSVAHAKSGQPHIEPMTFVFDSMGVSSIVAAAEYYRDNYVVDGIVVSGFIKRLDRKPGDESGTVTIAATLRGVDKNVSVELGKTDYLEAVTAHRANEIVRVSGDVHVTARTAKVLNPTDFRVIRPGDLF